MISVKKNEHRHCDWRRRCHSGLPPPPAPLPSLRHSSLFTCNISLPLSRSPSPCSGVSGQTGGCGATCLLHSRQWTFLRMCILPPRFSPNNFAVFSHTGEVEGGGPKMGRRGNPGRRIERGRRVETGQKTNAISYFRNVFLSFSCSSPLNR